MNLLNAYNAIAELHAELDRLLSQQDVNYDIQFGKHSYKFESTFTVEDAIIQTKTRKKLIRALLKHHLIDIVNHVVDKEEEHWTPKNLIIEVLSYAGERPDDATLEIVSEEYDIGINKTLATEGTSS